MYSIDLKQNTTVHKQRKLKKKPNKQRLEHVDTRTKQLAKRSKDHPKKKKISHFV
jgi:hypothetical protein